MVKLVVDTSFWTIKYYHHLYALSILSLCMYKKRTAKCRRPLLFVKLFLLQLMVLHKKLNLIIKIESAALATPSKFIYQYYLTMNL